MVSERTWKAIYRLLDRVSLREYDCGSLCGAACCSCGQLNSELGIYLYPGEEALHKRPEDPDKDWLLWSEQSPEECGLPETWPGPVYFVRCKTPPVCPRELRPLQCRTFPLKPYLGENGVLELIWNDEELPYRCPFIEEGMPVNDDFYHATYTVWTHLMRDPVIYELIAADSAEWETEETVPENEAGQ